MGHLRQGRAGPAGAEVELNRAKRALEDSRKVVHGGTGTTKQLTKAEDRFAQAASDLDLKRERENGALSAAQQAERERDALLRTHLDLFADEAEQATQAAAEALEALAGPLGSAQEAWTAAVAAWQPIAKVAGVAGVQAWPLPDPQQLVADARGGALVARPAKASFTT
jgi:hypothetical protein